jgi:hypothetical protein
MGPPSHLKVSVLCEAARGELIAGCSPFAPPRAHTQQRPGASRGSPTRRHTPGCRQRRGRGWTPTRPPRSTTRTACAPTCSHRNSPARTERQSTAPAAPTSVGSPASQSSSDESSETARPPCSNYTRPSTPQTGQSCSAAVLTAGRLSTSCPAHHCAELWPRIGSPEPVPGFPAAPSCACCATAHPSRPPARSSTHLDGHFLVRHQLRERTPARRPPAPANRTVAKNWRRLAGCQAETGPRPPNHSVEPRPGQCRRGRGYGEVGVSPGPTSL